MSQVTTQAPLFGAFAFLRSVCVVSVASALVAFFFAIATIDFSLKEPVNMG